MQPYCKFNADYLEIYSVFIQFLFELTFPFTVSYLLRIAFHFFQRRPLLQHVRRACTPHPPSVESVFLGSLIKRGFCSPCLIYSSSNQILFLIYHSQYLTVDLRTLMPQKKEKANTPVWNASSHPFASNAVGNFKFYGTDLVWSVCLTETFMTRSMIGLVSLCSSVTRICDLLVLLSDVYKVTTCQF